MLSLQDEHDELKHERCKAKQKLEHANRWASKFHNSTIHLKHLSTDELERKLKEKEVMLNRLLDEEKNLKNE